MNRVMRYLLIDLQNLLYRTYFADKSISEDNGLAFHTALMSMNKFYKQHKPYKIIVCCDRPSWRKKYTASDECVSKVPYKGDRRIKFTPKEKLKFQQFLNHVSEFEELLRVHTNIVVLAAEGVEADDFIAGFCEAYGEDGNDDIIIVSRDRDLAQLQGKGKDTIYPNIMQYDPTTGDKITLETAIKHTLKSKSKRPIPFEHNNSEYFMFIKCLRGDKTDNVQSAYPGVRATRINKAFSDPFEMVNLLNETWTCGIREKTFTVKDLIQEGRHLMDLRKQPDNIRKVIFQTILDEMDNPGIFDYFKFMAWLGKYEMKRISQNLETFIPLLNL